MNYILLLFLLTACIFESVEKGNNPKNVEVVIVNKNEPSFIMKKDIEKNFIFTEGTKSDYRLLIEAKSDVENSTIVSNNSFTVVVTVKANYKLINNENGKIIFSSSISNSSNFTTNQEKITAEYIQTKQIIKNLSNIIASDIYKSIEDYYIRKDIL